MVEADYVRCGRPGSTAVRHALSRVPAAPDRDTKLDEREPGASSIRCAYTVVDFDVGVPEHAPHACARHAASNIRKAAARRRS